MSEYEQIKYERRGPVAIVTIDRPERMNAIGPTTHLELVERIAALPQPAIRTDHEAVVRGFGRPLETPEILEGLRQFNERDHPDRRDGDAATPGIARPLTSG